MPEQVRIEFKSFKRQHSGKAIGQYWIESCQRKGLYDDLTNGAILYSPDRMTEAAFIGTSSPTASSLQENKTNSATPKPNGNRRRSRTKQSASTSSADNTGRVTTGAEAADCSNNIPNLDDTLLQSDPFGAAIDTLLGGDGLEGPDANDMYNLSGFLNDVDNTVGDLKPAAVGSAPAPALAPAGTSIPHQQSALEALDVLGGGQEQTFAQEATHGTPLPLPPPTLHDGSSTATASTSPIPAQQSVPRPHSIPSSPTTGTSILQKISLACGIVEAVRAMDVFPESNENTNARHNLDALQFLGEQLYEHFCGFRPFSTANQMDSTATAAHTNDTATSDGDDDDGDQRSKRGKVIESGSYIPLSDMGFPSSLSILVQHLCSIDTSADINVVDTSVNIPYESVDDVLEELQLMSNDPDRYLFGGSVVGAAQTGTLHFEEGKLYGREEELSDVMNAFRNLKTNERREVLCITGDSGTGKSALAMQMRKPVEDMGGYFLAEKFDELQQVQQVPAVFSALNHFCADVCRRGGSVLDNMRERLHKALGSNGKVLVGLIPNLSNIIEEYQGAAGPNGVGVSSPELTGQAASMRLLFFSRQLIKTISCPEHPAVLLLDDMQWADELSLQLLEAVTTDDEIKSFLVIACYRDGEVSVDHPLQQRLGAIHRAGTVLSEIHVDNIGKESVNRLVSDALHISPSQARPLANLVHSKTSGQPLFVIQFLKSLSDEGLLRFSLSSRQWQWDLDAISAKRVADNVAELMTAKMLRYPVEVLWSLKLAACLGHECDKTMLDLLGPGSGGSGGGNNGSSPISSGVPSIAEHLDVAVADGLIIKSGTSTKAVYRFSHDQIQYAAYSLIALDEQMALHLQIARVLFEKASPEELDGMLFVVLDQFGRGSPLLVDRSEKTRVAQLYSMAAKRSFSTFAHLSASIFALQGILLLDEDHWRTDYELALALYSTSAEAHNICGVFDQVETCANIVFAQARSFEDKLPAYFSLVQVTGAKGRLLDATNLGLDVLQKLGIILPANPDIKIAMAVIDQTRVMLEAIPAETLIGRKMQDAKALAAMKMLQLLCRYTYMARQELMGLLVCIMIQMTAEHGICDESIIAFSCYGYIACNTGQLVLGHKYGKLALSLLEQSKAKGTLPSVFMNVYTMMIPIDPVQAAFPQMDIAHNVAMAYGDFEVGNMVCSRGTAVRFFFGDYLGSIEASTRNYFQDMQKANEENFLLSASLFLQAVLNLMDPTCSDPSTLTGEVTNQTDVLEKAQQSNNTAIMIQVCRLRIYLLYLFGLDELAGELVESLTENFSIKRPFPNSGVVSTTFLTGLVAAVMSRKKDPSKWMPIANSCRGKIEVWSQASSWNYKHMLRFIEAEIAYSEGHHEEAKVAYDEAIRLAGEHRFIHDQALCLERAAFYHADVSGGSSAVTAKYLAEARDLYIKWGAHRKASDIQIPVSIE